MPKTKVTPRAKHPEKTEAFLATLKEAMEDFEDEISSLTLDIHRKAYKKFVKKYKEALTVVWDLARFADVTLVLQTIDDREMLEMAVMARKINATFTNATSRGRESRHSNFRGDHNRVHAEVPGPRPTEF